ncbi:hypothetical protein ILYODFUR_000364 [Ilyodon furcidens]|uniref:Uncharacterized protein n=2 Tax=Goodeidae TaxID=28758 RepID=A0ABV0UF75_9TELE
MIGKPGREKEDVEKTRIKQSIEPQCASQRAVCQFVFVAYSKPLKQMANGESLQSKTKGLTTEDLPLIAVCLHEQSQEEVPGQRLPAIAMAFLEGQRGKERKVACCQGNTVVNRNIRMLRRTFLAKTSPEGKGYNHGWHHAKRKLCGIYRRNQKPYKQLENSSPK